ncbi:hypothetical protein MD484_g7837, partial [Candolleomyces efflorescens]
MSLTCFTPEEFYSLHEDDLAPVAPPPPYTYYPDASKLLSTAVDAPLSYSQIPAPHVELSRTSDPLSPLVSSGTLFLGMYRDEGEDYLDFAGRAACSMSDISRRRRNTTSGGSGSRAKNEVNGGSKAEQREAAAADVKQTKEEVIEAPKEDEVEEAQPTEEDIAEAEQIEEDVATVRHFRRTAVERLEEIYANLFPQNHDSSSPRDPHTNYHRTPITKLVIRDPHFEGEDNKLGLTSSIATELVFAALLSRVASTSSAPYSPATYSSGSASTSTFPSSSLDISISSLRLEEFSFPLLHTTYPQIHSSLNSLVQSPLLRELTLNDVTLEPRFAGVFGHLHGLEKLELRNVTIEENQGVRTTRVHRGMQRTYLKSFSFKNSSEVVSQLLTPSSQHCLAFSKVKHLGLDFGSGRATYLSGVLLGRCKAEVETLTVCFESNSDFQHDVAPKGQKVHTLANLPALRRLELSFSYELTSFRHCNPFLNFLKKRGPIPPGVDVKVAIRGIPVTVPPFELPFSSTTPSSPPDSTSSPPSSSTSDSSSPSSPPSPSSDSPTSTKPTDPIRQFRLDSAFVLHTVLAHTVSKIDEALSSRLPAKRSKVEIQVAFDTTATSDTYMQASDPFRSIYSKAGETLNAEADGGRDLEVLQLQEDLDSYFNPAEPGESDLESVEPEEEEDEEDEEESRLVDLTRRFKALYFPKLASKHEEEEVELVVDLVDVYDVDEDQDQQVVEGELISGDTACPQDEDDDVESDGEDLRIHFPHPRSRLASLFPSTSSGSSSSSSSFSDEEEREARSPLLPLRTSVDSDSASDSEDDEGDEGDDGLVWTSADGGASVTRIGSTFLVVDPRLPGCEV